MDIIRLDQIGIDCEIAYCCPAHSSALDLCLAQTRKKKIRQMAIKTEYPQHIKRPHRKQIGTHNMYTWIYCQRYGKVSTKLVPFAD